MENPFVSGKCLAKARPGEDSPVDGETKVTGFAWGGEECEPTSKACLAKVSYDPETRRTRHFLKRATVGPEAGRLFNPQSATFDPSLLGKVTEYLGRGGYEWRPAHEEAFVLYLKFLKGGNPVDVRCAERIV